MPIAQNFTLFKSVGIVGTVLVLIILFGSGLIAVTKAVKTGDWSAALTETGGKIGSIDASLNDETEYLLNENNQDPSYLKIFHFAYSFILIFAIFFVLFAMFKFGNWLIGLKQFSPSSDIMLIAVCIAILAGLQFAYTYYVLGQTLFPFSGIYNYIKHLPAIANNLTL